MTSDLTSLLDTPGGYARLLEIVQAQPHPVLPIPTEGQCRSVFASGGDAAIFELFTARREAIEQELADPYRYGYIPSCWRDADKLLEKSLLLAVFGGNGAAKTFYGARRGVQLLVEQPGSKVLWLHESEKSSIEVQQEAVHRYLPAEWRTIKKNSVANVGYSKKNGFSDNKFVFPNGSSGIFGSYKQRVDDYEGTGWNLIVADENLPLAWLKTLLIRLPRRGGKFIWTYTPIRGITMAVKEVVAGATTVESRPAELLPPERINVDGCPRGQMPYIQTSTWGSTSVIYFFSEMNPYAGYAEFARMMRGADATTIERRAYGYARNNVRTLFPLFGVANIIEPSAVPATITRYHYADPAGARNMFQIWVGVDPDGRHYIYREWPDVPRYGTWADPSEDATVWDGVPGPAQPTLGYSVAEYKKQMLSDEGHTWTETGWAMTGETVEWRKMDPRSGAAQTVAENSGAACLMDRFAETQTDTLGLETGPPLDFQPAPGLNEEEGLNAINALLYYQREDPICPLINEPKLYVSRDCQNVIWALQNYTAHDGGKAACKDPVDLLRYMATDHLTYIDPARPRSRGGGSY